MDLLDVLAADAELPSLSDLRDERHALKLLFIVSCGYSQDYSLDDWTITVQYITGEIFVFVGTREARDFLICTLSSNAERYMKRNSTGKIVAHCVFAADEEDLN